jgi:hypothetical protein
VPVVDVLPAMPVVDVLEALPAAPPPLPADVLDVLPPVELEPVDAFEDPPKAPGPPGLDSLHPASAHPHSRGNVTNRTVTNASFRMLRPLLRPKRPETRLYIPR